MIQVNSSILSGVLVSLLLFISRVNCMPAFLSHVTSTPLVVNPGDPEGMICGKALCKFGEPITPLPNNYCYKYKFCSKCSVSNVPDHPICYLLDNDPNYVHLMEGHLGPKMGSDHSNDHLSHEDHSSHYNHEGEHDEESFLQTYESTPLGFVSTTSPNDFDQGRRTCAVDAKGNVLIRVRLIIQWYGISKHDNDGHHEHEESHEDGENFLQNYSSGGIGIHTDGTYGIHSMLEKSHHDDEDDGDGSHHKSRLGNMATKFHKLKHTSKGAVGAFKSPKAKIYLMFSDPKVNACRSPLIYKGKITPGSMFVATITPTIPHLDLTPDMIKSSIQVILSCEGCHKTRINSCIQVTCAKNVGVGVMPINATPMGIPQMGVPLINSQINNVVVGNLPVHPNGQPNGQPNVHANGLPNGLPNGPIAPALRSASKAEIPIYNLMWLLLLLLP